MSAVYLDLMVSDQIMPVHYCAHLSRYYGLEEGEQTMCPPISATAACTRPSLCFKRQNLECGLF